jgi:5'-3' exonuclease
VDEFFSRAHVDPARALVRRGRRRLVTGRQPGYPRLLVGGAAVGRAGGQTVAVTGAPAEAEGRRVHLVDGTYELFRHFFGQPPRRADDGSEIGATRGVLLTVLQMLSEGATHIGVATDHVIESFRNDLWPGYKTSAGVDPSLLAQFGLLEDALRALGVTVWPMVDLEADDALASAAAVAGDDPAVARVLICTPDKDLAQSVVGERVVQLDRRKGVVTDAAGVVEKFGVAPTSIPDWLALVGDSADGFPGLSGWGRVSAAAVLFHYGHLEAIPDTAADWDPGLRQRVRTAPTLATRLAAEREDALLFRTLATLRIERSLLRSVDDLRWRGPTAAFDAVCGHLRDRMLLGRAEALADGR